MKALVYHGPGAKTWEEVPDPVIGKPTDAIVRVETTTICGTDLHILKGDVPAVTDGRILGHEGVGTISEVGSAVTDLAVGDRVIISCISACGKCTYCKTGVYSHCQADEGAPGIGWVFGHLIDGTQAELVRVPFAETSLYRVPDGVPAEEAVLISASCPPATKSAFSTGRSSRATWWPCSVPGRWAWRRSPPRGCTVPAASSPSISTPTGWNRPNGSARATALWHPIRIGRSRSSR
jgi:alcohol dehydrogenase